MKVRETNVSDSDKASAELFFDTLFQFYEPAAWKVLDAFARNGQLTVPNYMDRIKNRIDMWELGPEHADALLGLQANMEAESTIEIGDSYTTALTAEGGYDMIVIDTPQGVHADDQAKSHVEHFDFMRLALDKLIAPRGVLVLYVNRQPYDKNEVGSQGYDEYDEYDFKAWMEARTKFYRCHNPKNLQMNEALFGYQRLLSICGFELINTVIVPCFSDVPGKEPYAFRIALEVRRS